MLPKKQPNNFIKYSSMAIQMLAVIGGSVWLGDYLDEKNNTTKPYYTMVLSLIGIFVSIYLTLKDFIKKE
ncbi:MAG: AtpZ/AtpI family protein [Bacteroidota bacterium]